MLRSCSEHRLLWTLIVSVASITRIDTASGATASLADVRGTFDLLGESWKIVYSKDHDDVYFFNTGSRSSQWSDPREPGVTPGVIKGMSRHAPARCLQSRSEIPLVLSTFNEDVLFHLDGYCTAMPHVTIRTTEHKYASFNGSRHRTYALSSAAACVSVCRKSESLSLQHSANIISYVIDKHAAYQAQWLRGEFARILRASQSLLDSAGTGVDAPQAPPSRHSSDRKSGSRVLTNLTIVVAIVLPFLAALSARLIYLQAFYPDLLFPSRVRKQRRRENNKMRNQRARFKVSQDGKGGSSRNS